MQDSLGRICDDWVFFLWFYNNMLGIPTICTGCGSINHAHTEKEQIVLKDIAKEAAAVMLFIGKWSGYQV